MISRHPRPHRTILVWCGFRDASDGDLRGAASRGFPGRSVSGLLIYTSGPRLLRLEPDFLAATPISGGNLFKLRDEPP